MNYYLVDYENIKLDGIKDFNEMKQGDVIIIFYSEHCKNITLDVIANFEKLKLQHICFKVNTGTQNALDFQLSTYIGYLIGINKSNSNELVGSSTYNIVSNDKGYDCICKFWNDEGIIVKRISIKKQPENEQSVDTKVVEQTQNKSATQTKNKSTAPAKNKSKVLEKDIATLEELKKLLLESDEPQEVLKIFNQYKSKQAICNGIAKYFKDSKKAGTVYQKLKPLLKEKNKS
jgi:hypothetical protein